MICAIAGQWVKQTCQPCDHVPIHQNQSWKAEAVVLKWVIMKGWGLRALRIYYLYLHCKKLTSNNMQLHYFLFLPYKQQHKTL